MWMPLLWKVRGPGTTQDGRDILDCTESVVALAVDFTDKSTRGRYGFLLEVQNPYQNSVPNMWTLETTVGSESIDRGACAGYWMHNGTRQESAAEGLPVIALALLIQASS